MKKSARIFIIGVLLLALISGAAVYLIYQTRDDELLIGNNKAEQTALDDAGLAEKQVSELKSSLKLRMTDGQWYYKVSFRTIAMEYEYEIEAYTGGVLDRSSKKR